LPVLYWATDKVSGPESKLVTTGKHMSSQLQHGELIRAALIRLACLVLHAKLSSRLDRVVWGIFWKVFRRSCGPPTRSVGPTNRSAGLLVGRTYLLGTAVSLVGGDLGVPISHNSQTSFWFPLSRINASQLWYPEILHSGSNTSIASFYLSKVSEIL
jgi:hypothetical protein